MTNLAIYRSGRLYFLAPAGLFADEAILQRKSCFYRSQVLAVAALVEMTHKEARADASAS